ncbi:hypothetical protein DRW42_11540 [Pedobacter miscanthi]|uniref:Uncharacterized protein n=1 Tax=Pedobacter miscanthi TaxID=2259170 RepID=A0A366KYZ6_9SPHI|nr:hypothetical protein DRW42_11540 [Pedobacter miscanthi]
MVSNNILINIINFYKKITKVFLIRKKIIDVLPLQYFLANIKLKIYNNIYGVTGRVSIFLQYLTKNEN